MINPPKLNNTILEKLYSNNVISNDDLTEILTFDKTLLTQDCHAIINFCSIYYDTMEHDFDDDDYVSYNLLIYALFLLKEIDAKDQLQLILDILHWSEEKLDYWFHDIFTEFYWVFVYHFGILEIDKLVHFLKQKNLESFSKEQVAQAIYQIYLHNPYSATIISDYWTELLEFYNCLPKEDEIVDEIYFSFFIMYISQPNEHQLQLIKNLYEKDFIDYSMNGDFKEFYKISEPKREIKSIFEVNNDFINYENENDEGHSNFFEELKNLKLEPFITDKKINRNDPCPCGSGKKYKKCCLS